MDRTQQVAGSSPASCSGPNRADAAAGVLDVEPSSLAVRVWRGLAGAVRRHVAVARVDQAEERVGQQTGGGQAEQPGAVGLPGDLLQRTVEADRLLRVVVEGCFGDEDADQTEDDPASDVPDDTDPPALGALRPAHLAGAPPVLVVPA
jgi:hypothetical protein